MGYNWPMSAHASQAFSTAHCTDSEDLPKSVITVTCHRVCVSHVALTSDVEHSSQTESKHALEIIYNLILR